MHLIAMTGMRYAPKVQLVTHLAHAIHAQGHTLTLFDNTEKAITLDAVTQERFVGGCVCCSLAGSLIPSVWKATTDYALLPVSASADPETLARILETIQGTRVTTQTVALIDTYTREQLSYVAQRLAFYADAVLYEPFDMTHIIEKMGLFA